MISCSALAHRQKQITTYRYVQFTSTKQNYNATVRPKMESNKTFYNDHGLLPKFLLKDYKAKY